MRSMRPDKDISVSTIRIPTVRGSIPALVLSPKAGAKNAAGILWIHGGGYIAGMKEMVHMSRAVDLVKRFGTGRSGTPGKTTLPGSSISAEPQRPKCPAYAAPARAQDFADLPPAYTFVGDGEPFYAETLQYIENLKRAGISADVDVYHTDIHAFDLMRPELEISRVAAEKFNQAFAYAKEHYFAENL